MSGGAGEAGAPSCAHSPCEEGAKLPSDCDPCAKQVCAQDTLCCTDDWDANCAARAKVQCTLCGGDPKAQFCAPQKDKSVTLCQPCDGNPVIPLPKDMAVKVGDEVAVVCKSGLGGTQCNLLAKAAGQAHTLATCGLVVETFGYQGAVKTVTATTRVETFINGAINVNATYAGPYADLANFGCNAQGATLIDCPALIEAKTTCEGPCEVELTKQLTALNHAILGEAIRRHLAGLGAAHCPTTLDESVGGQACPLP